MCWKEPLNLNFCFKIFFNLVNSLAYFLRYLFQIFFIKTPLKALNLSLSFDELSAYSTKNNRPMGYFPPSVVAILKTTAFCLLSSCILPSLSSLPISSILPSLGPFRSSCHNYPLFFRCSQSLSPLGFSLCLTIFLLFWRERSLHLTPQLSLISVIFHSLFIITVFGKKCNILKGLYLLTTISLMPWSPGIKKTGCTKHLWN